MNTITHTALGVTHTFEIVDYIPCGYKIWNTHTADAARV